MYVGKSKNTKVKSLSPITRCNNCYQRSGYLERYSSPAVPQLENASELPRRHLKAQIARLFSQGLHISRSEWASVIWIPERSQVLLQLVCRITQ